MVTGTELERAQEYSDVLKELATLRQNLKASMDQLDRTQLRSPMRGIVNNLSVTTIGGVVRPGQEATVKLSAYDYTIYGTLKGEVKRISADTFKYECARDPDGDPHYKVVLAVDTANLTERQAALQIRPGMQASVELHTGAKTVLQYLLKP